MPAPGHILVVCTANICRSPMAAGLLEHALAAQPEPLRSLQVIAAGIAARDGELVSENSVIALKKVGIPIAGHKSLPVTQALQAIARKAIKRKTGARGLRSILENVLLDTMYELPTATGVSKVVIDESTIECGTEPLTIYIDQPKVSGSN